MEATALAFRIASAACAATRLLFAHINEVGGESATKKEQNKRISLYENPNNLRAAAVIYA